MRVHDFTRLLGNVPIGSLDDSSRIITKLRTVTKGALIVLPSFTGDAIDAEICKLSVEDQQKLSVVSILPDTWIAGLVMELDRIKSTTQGKATTDDTTKAGLISILAMAMVGMVGFIIIVYLMSAHNGSVGNDAALKLFLSLFHEIFAAVINQN